MSFVNVGNINLHYELEGRQDGLLLVFIHSLGTDLHIWDGVLPHFTGNFKIIRYDLRGHGQSDCPPGPYTIADNVTDLAGLLDQLHIEAAILIGISVGGLVAIGYAAAHPEHVKSLVLCDTGMTIGAAERWNQRIEKVQQKGMESVIEDVVPRWFTAAFQNQHAAEYRGYCEMLTRTPASGYTATCAAIRDADLTDAARTIKAKALVLCGTEDIPTPPESGRALADTMANARFVLIENAAHLPCIEQADTVAFLIKSFIQEADDGG